MSITMNTGPRRVLVFGAVLALSTALTLARAGAAACDVRLNEFMAAPGQDWDGNALYSARDDEWIELINFGLEADLSEYVITDADSTWRWRGSGPIGMSEHRTIFGSDAVAWQGANGKSIAGFSLANAGDTVRLWHVTAAETLLIESYTFKAHEGATNRSVGRLPDMTGGWALFDGLNPYTGALSPPGNGCMPTPRNVNVCGTTPADPSSWGRVKAVYR